MHSLELKGEELPSLVTEVPGPDSRAWIDRLAVRECPAVTARRGRRAQALGEADTDPIVWSEAVGSVVRDVDGNVFVDLTAGFGVASVGHRNPRVVAAATEQSGRMLHAMGDAFPDSGRIELMEALCRVTGMERVLLGSSGSDAIDAATKTARMATGRDAVLTFDASYHGLAMGALALTRYHEPQFRRPFEGQLGRHVREAEFGGAIPPLDDVAAVVVEPVQGRGGMRCAPPGWLAQLREAATAAGCLLVFDEIFSGFGRTGKWFAFEHEGVRPDLLCVGKSMAGGFPISACLGTAEAMDSWGASRGEAIHTQTFLGNPLGCAMAHAALEEVRRLLPDVAPRSQWLLGQLESRGWTVRGRGWMMGVFVPEPLRVSRRLLERGYIAMPAGENAEVLAITPPFTITEEQLAGFVAVLDEVVQ